MAWPEDYMGWEKLLGALSYGLACFG